MPSAETKSRKICKVYCEHWRDFAPAKRKRTSRVCRSRRASEFSTRAANAPSRGAGYLAKRDGLAAWGCRRESQLEHHALSRRVAGERSRDIRRRARRVRWRSAEAGPYLLLGCFGVTRNSAPG